MDWARVLAYVTGTVDQELLARNEYMAAENRILKAKLKGRLKLSDTERATLGEIDHRLGRKALADSQLWRGPCGSSRCPSLALRVGAKAQDSRPTILTSLQSLNLNMFFSS
jgi:hypothetical protein